jgi:hypothetical protein
MDNAAPAVHARQPKASRLVTGAVLIAIGAVVAGMSSIGLPVFVRLGEHQLRLAQLDSASTECRIRATRIRAAEQLLGDAWADYNPKILNVQIGLAAEVLDERALADLRTSIARQLDDPAPLEALEQLPPEITDRVDFAARRTAFRAAYADARRQIVRLFARISSVLARPRAALPDRVGPAPLIESDAVALETFFATEAHLGVRWEALRAVAQRAGDEAAAESDQADGTLAAEQHRGFVEVVLAH